MNATAMPNYTHFSAEEFAFDPAFQRWVLSPRPDTDQFWQQWLQDHPDKQTEVQLARQVVQGLSTGHPPPVNQQQIEQDVARMLQRVQQEEHQHQPMLRISRSPTYLRWAAAAIVLLAAGIGWLVNRPGTAGGKQSALTVQTLQGQPVFTNETNALAVATLPDGSTVTLSPNSTLRYEPTFGKQTRDVTLTGEAFFNVVRNEALPFRVFSDAIMTKVLGTSFRVSAYPKDRQLTVTVRTGKVSVYARSEHDIKAGDSDGDRHQPLISLTPNQAVQYSKKTQVFHKTLTNNPVPVIDSPAPDAFVFDETPIDEVFQQLEKTYGIDIIYDRNLLRDCALTASLGNENLSQKLTLICKGIEGRYEIVDGTIIIRSVGCH